MRKERTDWRGSGLEKQADYLVFLDESSVNIDLTRRYGRAIGKTRVHGHPIEHTPRTNRSGFRAPERSDDAHHVYRRYNGAALFGIPEGYPHSDFGLDIPLP